MRRNSGILFLLLFTLSMSRASAGGLSGWNEAPQFVVEINGKADLYARTFQPQDYKPFLIILSKELKQNLLMNLTSKEVFAIDPSVFKKKEEIAMYTEGIPKGKKLASYKVDRGTSVFAVEGKRVGVRIKETLTGEVPLSILLAHSPVYGLLRDAYTPKKSAIDFLKAYKKPVELVVMFATWCPTCKQMVPRLLRILKDAANANISPRFIGIAMGGSEPRDLLEKYGHDYPAFIFFENGREKGRIIGMTPNPIEETIVAILKK
jgi:thiol-disulfide isomerase/thioredoxin